MSTVEERKALNTKVLMSVVFYPPAFSLCFYLYFGGGNDISFLLTLSVMMRMLGIALLEVARRENIATPIVSAKTLQLYCISVCFRLISTIHHEGYLPYDKSGDWLYHSMETVTLIFAALAVFSATYKNYEELDTFGEFKVLSGWGAVYLAGPTLLLAVLVRPGFNPDFLSDTAWIYAMLLESVALIPQLYMFQKQASSRGDDAIGEVWIC